MRAARWMLVIEASLTLVWSAGCGGSSGGREGGADSVTAVDAVGAGDFVTAADTAEIDLVAADAAGTDLTIPDDGAIAADVPTSVDVPASDLAPAGWCERWPSTFCALLTRCPLPGAAATDTPTCEASLRATCPVDSVGAAVEAGDYAWDAAAASACLAELDTLDCDTLFERLRSDSDAPVAACWAALVGQVPAGGACRVGDECVEGARCSFVDGCPGLCVAAGAVGDPCDGERVCDLFTAVCVDGSCVGLPETPGDACVQGRCLPPLLCDPVENTCRVAALTGEVCGDGAGVCYPGLLCFGDGTCQPPRAEGASCFADSDCRSGPDERLVCAGGTCQRAPDVDEPCFDFLCAADAWCETTGVTPTCRELPAVGEPCTAGHRCAVGAWCDAGVCQSRAASGEPCATPSACASGRCYGGECRAPDAPPCD